MKLCGFVLWMCATNTTLSTALPSTPSIVKCEILEYTNITCYWETTNHTTADNSRYTLQVNKTICHSDEFFSLEGDCDTRGSQCSIQLKNSAFACFCADVLESTSSGFRQSPYFCFNGGNQVKLQPPSITHISPSPERPECFQVGWKMLYVLSENEKSYRWIQVEYMTHEQTRSKTVQAYSSSMEMCDLYPGSRYTVKLRAQDRHVPTHWSSWTSKEFTTAEKAPSAAPRLWRRIQPAEETRKRRLTLLWKSLSWPEANGVVLGYTAVCRSDVDSSQWTCGMHLDASESSCHVTVSVDACNCSLTATNSAGTSPASYIYIPADTDEDLPPPSNISIISLDDTRLKVEWTTASDQSETDFVVQWISILHNGTTILNWQYLNETSKSFILTGLLPEIPYNVSVMRVYAGKAGTGTSVIAFTREGAPSAGPKLTVLQTSAWRIHLRWDPVPIEKLHGFIKYYSVLYSISGKDKRERVNGDVDQIYLNGLMKGTYNVCVMAHTVTGGAAGPWQMVAVGHDDVEVFPILLCSLLLIFIILIIPVCVRVRIKHCLCPTVPDPSNSSLSVWSNCKPGQHMLTPLSTTSSFFAIGQTSCYHGYSEKDYGPVQHVPDEEDNPTSPKTYMNPNLQVCRTEEATRQCRADFVNQSYIKPDQITSAGYQDDYQSLNDPLCTMVLGYQRDPTTRDDLCDYIHVSQSYMSVTTVDTYRTLESDVLHVLPEEHSLSKLTLCDISGENKAPTST